MSTTLQSIREAAEKKIAESVNADSLEEIRVSILGKKGELTRILKGMKDLSPENDRRSDSR